MSVHNSEIAGDFEKVADLLEIKGENPFRIRAYRNVARIVDTFPEDMAAMVRENKDLTEIRGIGEDLAGKIREIVTTGKLSMLEDLEKSLPEGLLEIMNIPGLGGKRVKANRASLNRHLRAKALRRSSISSAVAA